MFNRKLIKQRAKGALKRRYWMVILVVAIVGLLGGTIANGASNSTGSMDLSGITDGTTFNWTMDGDTSMDVEENPWVPAPPADNPWEQYEDDADLGAVRNEIVAAWEQLRAEWNAMLDELSADWDVDLRMVIVILLVVLVCVLVVAWIVGLLITILFCNVVSVSGHGWMLRHLRGEDVGLFDAFAAFRIYKASVRTMFLRDLLVWLWSLLFVIPGTIKRYAYSMVPYILYENPQLSAKQAIRMSQTMTRGYKWGLFVMNLSFIGWQLLSMITGGVVGILWTNPYRGLAYAAAYEDLKWNAIQSGKLSWEDFDQDPPAPIPEDPVVTAWSQPVNDGWNDPIPQWQSPAPQSGTPPTPPSNPWNTPTDTRW